MHTESDLGRLFTLICINALLEKDTWIFQMYEEN